MDENLVSIKKEVLKYRDTLVIDFNKLVMLRGWSQDEEDYYWVYETFGLNTKVYQSSCVCGFIPLKDILKQKDYRQLEKWFEINRVYGYSIDNELAEINRS